MAEKDPYELLGVPRDASDERIRAAYELAINRATRDGAFRYAAELSTAYDTISSSQRRALYERHGFTAIRERSPGAAPPPRSWRVAQAEAQPVRTHRRSLVRPLLLLLILIVIAGLVIGKALSSAEGQRVRQQQVLCQGTTGGIEYTYTEPATNRPHCTNGAQPVIIGYN